MDDKRLLTKLDELRCQVTYALAQMNTVLSVLDKLTSELNVDNSGESKKKLVKAKTGGALVWESYQLHFTSRYKTEPARNAMTNRQATTLVQRLGIEAAVKVVEFYLRCNDQYYIKQMHPIGLCLKDAETLFTRMNSGLNVSTEMAKKAEKSSSSLNASLQYLKNKHGK